MKKKSTFYLSIVIECSLLCSHAGDVITTFAILIHV